MSGESIWFSKMVDMVLQSHKVDGKNRIEILESIMSFLETYDIMKEI